MAHGNATLRVCQLLRAGHPAHALMEYTQKKSRSNNNVYIYHHRRPPPTNQCATTQAASALPPPPCTQRFQDLPIRYAILIDSLFLLYKAASPLPGRKWRRSV